MKRTPAVAGTFYPAHAATLERLVGELSSPSGQQRIHAIGVVSPHAGYIYSGSVAGKVFARVRVPDTVVVIGPNHTGYGGRASIVADGTFAMPGFDMKIDRELAAALLENSDIIEEDPSAHKHEHSLEVQLPFIRFHNPAASIVPLCIMGRGFDFVSAVGNALAKSIRDAGRQVLIVASSDMTHYEPDAHARKKDALAIGMVTGLDPRGLLKVTAEHDISMCGVVPVAIMLVSALKLGATKAELVDYATSGEVTKDFDEVVGYAGIVVS